MVKSGLPSCDFSIVGRKPSQHHIRVKARLRCRLHFQHATELRMHHSMRLSPPRPAAIPHRTLQMCTQTMHTAARERQLTRKRVTN